LIQILLSILF